MILIATGTNNLSESIKFYGTAIACAELLTENFGVEKIRYLNFMYY